MDLHSWLRQGKILSSAKLLFRHLANEIVISVQCSETLGQGLVGSWIVSYFIPASTERFHCGFVLIPWRWASTECRRTKNRQQTYYFWGKGLKTFFNNWFLVQCWCLSRFSRNGLVTDDVRYTGLLCPLKLNRRQWMMSHSWQLNRQMRISELHRHGQSDYGTNSNCYL